MTSSSTSESASNSSSTSEDDINPPSLPGDEGSSETASAEKQQPSQAHIVNNNPAATAPISEITDTAAVKPVSPIHIALAVLEVLETYALQTGPTHIPWSGLAEFVPEVAKQIESNQPIRLLLPGFPFKSPNSTDKVLGVLPDLGEKLALAHLQGLCENVGRVYDKGAEVWICSDGLVYNDLLGVSDEHVWDYGEALRRMAEDNGLHGIKFIRLWDLLDHDESGQWTKEYYLQHASCIRRELLYRYRDVDFEADISRTSNSDARLTYQSYITYVAKDLAHSPVLQGHTPESKELKVQSIAKNMMLRWKAYGAALQANRPEYVRLSIHDSANRKGKLPISMLPQEHGANSLTPWHSVIAVELDGSYRTVHASEVRDTYELVRDENGRPSHYRARSDMFDWHNDGLDVMFDHLYPTGIIIRPVPSLANETSPAPSISKLPMQKVRRLSQTHSPIVLRGFSSSTDESLFLAKGHELGEILTWTFGQILKVHDSRETDKNANNVTSNEAMPMHFDGIFKFVDHVDEATGEVKKVLTPPGYQYFTCISTAPKGDGYTLFAASRLFFRYLPSPFTLERLEKATWSMVNDGFWSAKQIGLPLVVRHKDTGAPCLRWHEPWTKTKFSKYYIEIENDEAGQDLVAVVNKLLYDYRVCLRFEWEQGDLLVNDNVAMLHTRTAFSGECDREMWRIHFD
ncbi:putative pyoverdine/dityrosine biosynthesis protein [Pyrenochaeta sp. MPI-SDFR-AT-0127]|nr:putative pyoverdine/dityrosine biosynthesis protein [Pyrenochaeta sp. MPI-SDFR-AT-0127]